MDKINERKCFYKFTKLITERHNVNDQRFDNSKNLAGNMALFLQSLDASVIEDFTTNNAHGFKCKKHKNYDSDRKYAYRYECHNFSCQHRLTILGYLFPDTFGLSDKIEYYISVTYNDDNKIISIRFVDF